MRDLKVNRDLVDPEINALGIKQCERSRIFVNEIKFDTVLVSPMYRTLMTTVYLFKDHPEKD